MRVNQFADASAQPQPEQHAALYAEGVLSGHGCVLGQPQRTSFAQAQPEGRGFRWHSILTFPQKVRAAPLPACSPTGCAAACCLQLRACPGGWCLGTPKAALPRTEWRVLQWRDLPADAQLALTVWQTTEGHTGRSVRGGSTLRLFSKKGRLKTGLHTLQAPPGPPPACRMHSMCCSCPPCLSAPDSLHTCLALGSQMHACQACWNAHSHIHSPARHRCMRGRWPTQACQRTRQPSSRCACAVSTGALATPHPWQCPSAGCRRIAPAVQCRALHPAAVPLLR